MKAVVRDAYGSADVLRLGEVAKATSLARWPRPVKRLDEIFDFPLTLDSSV